MQDTFNVYSEGKSAIEALGSYSKANKALIIFWNKKLK